MKTLLTLLGLTTALIVGTAQVQADLIAGWDFQTTNTGGTVLAAQDAAQPTVFTANFGSGTLYFDGSEGSSSWISTNTASRELNAFSGTAVNATNGLSTNTTSPAAIALVNSNANGKMAVFKFDLTGYQDLSLTFSAQRTGTGFNSQLWEWSTNGSTYSSIGTLSDTDILSSFASTGILSFTNITGLNNASSAYVRVTVSGASAAAGNNRMDNIQFNANLIPEPTSLALIGLGALGMAGYMIRRRKRH